MNTRGCISFVFDDGYEDVYAEVVPLLEKHGFRGVFAVPLDGTSLEKETQEKIRPWREWTPVSERGHEIAAHGSTHRDITRLSPEERARELEEPARALSASTIVYPGGAYNDTVAAAAQMLYSAGRTIRSGFESMPPADPWRLKSYNFSKNNFSLFKANSLALWAWATNSWLIETYHLVRRKPSPLLHSTALHDFEQHLLFIKKFPLAIKTIRDITVPS